MRAPEKRALAYKALGVVESAVSALPHITSHIRIIETTISRVSPNLPTDPIYYLRCADHDEARRFLAAYDSLPKYQRKLLPLEAFCSAAGVSPIRILEIIVGTCVRLGAQASSIIAAVNHPRVVEKTVEMALTDDGTADRTLLHRATGFLPSPKGAQTTIHVAASAQAAADAKSAQIAAPPPENTIRRLSDRLHAARQPALPPSSAVEIPVETVQNERELVVTDSFEEPEEED